MFNTQILPLPGGEDEELRWADKDPGDTVPARLDADAYLAALGASVGSSPDSIATVSPATVSPSDMVASSPINTATAMSWRFTGGTSGIDYTVSIMFTTTAGFVVRRNVYMRCLSLSLNLSGAQPTAVLIGPQGPPLSGSELTAAFVSVLPTLNIATSYTGAETIPMVQNGVLVLGSIFSAYEAKKALLPTTPAGLNIGDEWNNAGIITKVAPP